MAWRRGQAYGQDLRDRVLACPDPTLVQVAPRFGVSPFYVSNARARLRQLGDPPPGAQHNHVPLRLAPLTSALRAQIDARLDATLLYLPPCSPDLNPIELAVSKLKRLLRDAAERTVEALWKTIGKLPDQFSPTECVNYIRHCGFTQSER